MANEKTEKAVLFIGANRPIVGREQEARQFWSEAGPWLDTQQAAGFISRWDGFWLTAHGGDLNHAYVCFGERIKLDEWRRTDEFEAFVFRLSSCMTDPGVIPGVSYTAGKETIERRNKAVGVR